MKQILSSASLCILLSCLVAGDTGASEQILNEPIKTIYFEDLTYPLAAKLGHVQGIVVVRAQLDGEGRVTSANAVSGPKSLVQDCVSNSKKWRFQPNSENAVVLVYRFKFEGLCNLPCASQFRFEPPNFATITTGSPVIDHSGQ